MEPNFGYVSKFGLGVSGRSQDRILDINLEPKIRPRKMRNGGRRVILGIISKKMGILKVGRGLRGYFMG